MDIPLVFGEIIMLTVSEIILFLVCLILDSRTRESPFVDFWPYTLYLYFLGRGTAIL